MVEPPKALVLPHVLDVADAEEAPADEELSERAEAPSASTDVRGLGTDMFPCRAGARHVRARSKGLRVHRKGIRRISDGKLNSNGCSRYVAASRTP